MYHSLVLATIEELLKDLKENSTTLERKREQLH